MILYLIQIVPILCVSLIEGQEIKSLAEIGDIQKYEVSSSYLLKKCKYEVRISYLGTIGGSFKLSWGCTLPSSRKLLDTEKITFFTDEEGKIIGGCNIILVQALRNSRSSRLNLQEASIWYNIKLEKYHDTFQVPESVLPTIIGVIISLIFAAILYKILLFFVIKNKVKEL